MADQPDHLEQAKELLANYWQREPVTNDYGEIDPVYDAACRQAELMTILVYALIALVEAERSGE